MIRTIQFGLTEILAIIFSLALHVGIIFLIKPGTPYIGSNLGKELQVQLSRSPREKSTTHAETAVEPKITTHANSTPSDEQSDPQETQKTETLLTIPEEHYYKINELDVSPRPISIVNPAYPDSVPLNIKHGSVTLLLKLDESGVVIDAATLASTPEGFFENTARNAFIGARFTPGIKNGITVKTQLTLTIHFRSPILSNTE